MNRSAGSQAVEPFPADNGPAERVRVLHVVQSLNYGGMERLLADIVRRVNPALYESHVLVLRYFGRFSRGLEEWARLHQSEPLPRYSMLWPGALARQFRSIAPDVVHTHSGVWYKASLAARLAGVRHVVHTDHGRHLPDPWVHRALDGIAARRTDVVVAVSEALGEHLRRAVVPRHTRVEVIPNGVDTEAHRPGPDTGRIRRELGLAPEAPVIGSIGRLQPVKGYDLMVRAFLELRRSWNAGPAPVLVIAGDGPQREGLAGFAAAHGIGESVHLLGWRDDIPDLHSAFSLFTMSSRSEGTSVSLLEAMSAGLCPVVTDVGGNRAVLGADLEHRLVPPGDVDALADAWRDALVDAAGAARDAATARRRVEVAFSLDRMIGRYEQLYSVR